VWFVACGRIVGFVPFGGVEQGDVVWHSGGVCCVGFFQVIAAVV
jgi:hypothetical protein